MFVIIEAAPPVEYSPKQWKCLRVTMMVNSVDDDDNVDGGGGDWPRQEEAETEDTAD